MSQILGNWHVEWTDTDATSAVQTHRLRVPLQRVRPATRVNRWVGESDDLSTRDVVYAGGVYEVVADVDEDDAPASLAAMILAGLKGLTLTITPDPDDGASVDVYLIEPGEDWVANMSQKQGAFREYQTTLRIRRTDGSQFPAWVYEGSY